MEEENKLEEKTNAYKKGIELEKEFCEYLKTDLGWEKARIRSQMASGNNMRGTNVDIIASRIGVKGQKLEKIGVFYIFFFSLFMLFGFYSEYQDEDGIVPILFGLFFEIIGVIVLVLSYKYLKEHAWVECKNIQGKVNINQVQKTITELREYNESNNKDYRFIETYFVSTNGFIENALNLAVKNKIRCFIKTEKGFKEVDYWED